MTYDPTGIEETSHNLFVAIGKGPEHEGLVSTPDRMTRAWCEMYRGLTEDPHEHLHTQFHAGANELVLACDVTFLSVYEHRPLPFYGRARVGYIPRGGAVTSLSKLAHVAEGYAHRPQVQERLTAQATDMIDEIFDPQSVIVVIEAGHICMSVRGISKPGSSTMAGALRDTMSGGATRTEMMALVLSGSR